MDIPRRAALTAALSVPLAATVAPRSWASTPTPGTSGDSPITAADFQTTVTVDTRVAAAATVPQLPDMPKNSIVNAQGVLMTKAPDGKYYHHPLVIARYITQQVNAWRTSGDANRLAIARHQADALIADTVWREGGAFLPYRFRWGVVGHWFEPPWYSGMTQGVATGAFGILGDITGDPRYVKHAQALFHSLELPYVNDRMPWVSGIDANGMLWLDEYPLPGGKLSTTYNGHCYAALSLHAYHKVAVKQDAALARRVLALANGAVTTAYRYREAIRRPGNASSYQAMVVRPHPVYHAIHAELMDSLYMLTGKRGFATTLDHLIADYPITRSAGTLVLEAGAHTLYQYDSQGRQTATRKLPVARATTAPTSLRSRYLYNAGSKQNMLQISGGPYKGWWVHEVPQKSYQRGMTSDAMKWNRNRPVVLQGGQRIVATRFDANGKPFSQFARTLASTTTALSDQRACIRGQQMIHIVSGTFSGHWVPEGPVARFAE